MLSSNHSSAKGRTLAAPPSHDTDVNRRTLRLTATDVTHPGGDVHWLTDDGRRRARKDCPRRGSPAVRRGDGLLYKVRPREGAHARGLRLREPGRGAHVRGR